MEMKVKHRLATLLAIVDDNSITIDQAALLGNLACSQQKLAENLLWKKIYNKKILKITLKFSTKSFKSSTRIEWLLPSTH
jgi:hypothetical protein